MADLRAKLVEFGTKLDYILEGIIRKNLHVGFFTTVGLAFQVSVSMLNPKSESNVKCLNIIRFWAFNE